MSESGSIYQQLPLKKIFLLSWLSLLLLYLPSYNAGFYGDFSYLLYTYYHSSFSDFINRSSSGYGIKSMYQVTQFAYWILVSILDKNTILWYLLFTLLHTLTGITLLLFFKELLRTLGISTRQHFLLYSAYSLFLLGHVCVEVVVWKACLHYFNALIIIFTILRWLLLYLRTQDKKYSIYSILLYALSTFTLELFYLTPVFVFIIILFLASSNKISIAACKQSLLYYWLPLCGIWLLYLLGFRLLYGTWLAHRAAPDENILLVFHPFEVISKWSQYVTRVVAIDSTFPLDLRQKMYKLFYSLSWQITGCVVLAILMIITFIRLKKLQPKIQLAVLLVLLAASSTIVTLPYWYNDIFPYLNDRYYYLLWAFGSFLLVVLTDILFKPRLLKYTLTGAYLIINSLISFRYILNTHYAGTIFWGLINDFRWYDNNKKVYICNLPNYYDGVGIFNLQDGNEFREYLQLYKPGKTQIAGVALVASYNVVSPDEKGMLSFKNDSTVKVALSHWGSWWWYKGQGAVEYSTESYAFKMDEFADNGGAYRLELKKSKLDSNCIFLIQNGTHWDAEHCIIEKL